LALGRRAKEAAAPDTPTPKPSHHRYLRALLELLDEGEAVTQVAIARRLKISRQSLWKMHNRYPWLAKWASERIERVTAELIGPVIRKMGLIGLRGSKDHAELFLKASGKVGSSDAGEQGPRTGPTIVNIAIPRPDGGAALVQVKAG
jgi:hypothetical protein